MTDEHTRIEAARAAAETETALLEAHSKKRWTRSELNAIRAKLEPGDMGAQRALAQLVKVAGAEGRIDEDTARTLDKVSAHYRGGWKLHQHEAALLAGFAGYLDTVALTKPPGAEFVLPSGHTDSTESGTTGYASAAHRVITKLYEGGCIATFPASMGNIILDVAPAWLKQYPALLMARGTPVELAVAPQLVTLIDAQRRFWVKFSFWAEKLLVAERAGTDWPECKVEHWPGPGFGS